MNRHDLSLRQRTHIAQKLPRDIDTKVTSFQRFVIDLRKEHDFELRTIGNIDETPMFFDMPGSRTVKGSKTVSVKTSGSEKSHFTVILSCLAGGTKLKPVSTKLFGDEVAKEIKACDSTGNLIKYDNSYQSNRGRGGGKFPRRGGHRGGFNNAEVPALPSNGASIGVALGTTVRILKSLLQLRPQIQTLEHEVYNVVTKIPCEQLVKNTRPVGY
jgi:hypothetical protein